jgi:mono/diheme cytochrome c family protein
MIELRKVFVPVGIILTIAVGARPVNASAEKGRQIFEEKCLKCHTIGEGKMVGPDLLGVTEKRDRVWLKNWIADPEKVIMSGDPVANNLLKEFNIQMPAYGLSETEIASVISYLETFREKKVPDVSVPFQIPKKKSEAGFISRTYLQSYQDSRGNRYVPFYEQIEIDIRDRDRKWCFYSSGWIRYDLKALSFDEREMDELTYAFLRYSPFADRSMLVTAGRHLVFEGVASEQTDGLSLRWEVTPRVGFALYGGRPVETEYDGKRGDLIYGSRVFYRHKKTAETGLSFLREDNNGSRFREDYGVDLWLRPGRQFEFQGHSFFNNITGGAIEHSYDLRFFPCDKLTVSGFLTRSNYADAFWARTLSAFSPDILGKNEQLTKTGVSAEYRLDSKASLSLQFTGYEYDKSGPARYYGAHVEAEVYGVKSGLFVRRMEGETERLRYIEIRAYAQKKITKATVTVDTVNIHYDSPYNGLSNAYSLNAALGYRINNSLQLEADINHAKTPDFTGTTTAMLKLVYRLRREL